MMPLPIRHPPVVPSLLRPGPRGRPSLGRTGTGRPLVLLHGLCDSHRTWFPVAPALARSRRVLMLDLAGHGESSRPDASYTLDWHANLVGAWLEVLGLNEVDLVGIRLAEASRSGCSSSIAGASVASCLEAAGGLGREVGLRFGGRRFPSSSSASGSHSCRWARRGRSTAAGGAFSEEEIADLAQFNARPGTARAFSRSVRDVIDGWGQRRHFLDRAHEAPSLPPIAIFWGDEDPLIPVAHGIEAASLLEGALLTRFPGVGHFPHRQEPTRYVQALEAFLNAPDFPCAQLREPRRRARPHGQWKETFLATLGAR